ncbi:hypothetical protein NEAUS07_1068 [Nematocida ausubeli]|nr:hypothetical protein NEAUS07_1068 [Nematocida ausubeli]
MSNEYSSISCIHNRKDLIYGLWDGSVRIISNGTANSISLKSPATAILESSLNTAYIGTVKGDIWEVKNERVACIIKASKSIKHTDINMQAVIGIHMHSEDMIIGVYVHGEIVVYNTKNNTVMKKVQIDEKITSSYAENGKILCILESSTLLIYNIDSDSGFPMKSLLSDTEIDHAIFLPNTRQNIIAYSTPIGKVCVDYANRPGTGFVFKAHKQVKEAKEIYYPVTLLQPASATQVITGGADGEVHLWDVKHKTKVRTILSTKKCIITGAMKRDENNTPLSLTLVLSEGLDSLCEIEGTHHLVEVSLSGSL